MNKHELEMSIALWEIEKMNMLEKNSLPDECKELIDVLDPLIGNGRVSYTDFLEDVIKALQEETADEKSDTPEGRKGTIKRVYSKLTEYYKNRN